MSTEKYILINDKTIAINVKKGEILSINKKKISPEIKTNKDGEFQVTLNKTIFTGEVVKLKQNQCTVLVNGNTYKFTIETEKSFKRLKKVAQNTTDYNLSIPAMLPGLICEILVDVGQQVQKGETLLTLEAMKMQNEVLCPHNGLVKQIYIKSGDNVIKDQVLIEMEPVT